MATAQNNLLKRIHSSLGSPLFFWVCLGISCFTFIPFLLLGGDSHFLIHDQLDGDLPVMKAMIDHGDIFHISGNLDYLMNGIPRACGRTGFNLTSVLFTWFNAPLAYIINYILGHLVAFAGMYLLLKKHLLKDSPNSWLAPIVALLFSQVSWYPMYGWFVAGQPMLYHVFLNLYKQKAKAADWIFIALFPFSSAMILIAPFIIPVLVTGLAYFFLKEKAIPKKYAWGLGLLCLCFMLTDLGMLNEALFAKSFVSHRTEWPLPDAIGIKAGMSHAMGVFFFTHFHAGQFLTRFIILALLIAASLYFYEKQFPKFLFVFPAAIFLICLFQAFSPSITHYFGGTFSLLKVVQIDRFYNLLPCFWLIFFALLLNKIFMKPLLWIAGAGLILLQLFAIVKENKEFVESSKILLGNESETSFNQFFAPVQFAEIRKFIGKPQQEYKVGSIGLQPAVAIFNGFSTIDGYISNYPIAYKKRFRNVIAGELGRMPDLQKYFDEWGSRCYLLSSDINGKYGCTKNESYKIKQLHFNMKELKGLGCDYLLSSVEILGPAASGLTFEKKFTSETSIWDIYLYKLLPVTN